jgi:maltose/maltodextrin transport system permease protein
MNPVQIRYDLTWRLAKNLGIIALLLVTLFPIFYVISLSLNPYSGIGEKLIPESITFNHWRYILGIPFTSLQDGNEVLTSFPIMRWFFNSLKVAGITSCLMLLLSTTSAYAISRFRFKGRKLSIMSLLIIQMFPNIMAMVAFYLMLDFIGHYLPALGTDTHGGLILVYLGGTPFNIWLIKGYFDTIPRSLDESAIMDGCSRLQIFYKIILPLSTPILAVVGLLTFINTFSDFVLPSILLKSQEQMTFAVGIQIFISEGFAGKWGPFAAACIMGAIPICTIFFTIHRYIVAGLAAGSTKG